jgi:hypothetical protein
MYIYIYIYIRNRNSKGEGKAGEPFCRQMDDINGFDQKHIRKPAGTVIVR